jgi:glycosyltransferase involved in cell wall biosynthesis
LATHPTDVFHEIHTNIPPVKSCAVVVTAYHYFDDPILFATRPFRYYRWALSHRADLVLPISDATRDDFHVLFGVPLARMRTVHLGLSQSFAAAASPPPAGRFLLSPYNLSAPKNLRSLIAAWPAIAERYPDIDLVLYGRALVTPALEAAFDDMLRAIPHADRIRRIGHVSDRELSTLYAGCALFVFPTTVEGFGYPLLEAMAHGACCITRNASAMREIGGDAVRLVETLRPAEISAAAIDLLADSSLRASLGARARQRASAFTVEAMSRNTLECYLAVARGSRTPA